MLAKVHTAAVVGLEGAIVLMALSTNRRIQLAEKVGHMLCLIRCEQTSFP